jgi:hypothetical protein
VIRPRVAVSVMPLENRRATLSSLLQPNLSPEELEFTLDALRPLAAGRA